ncbi:MAG: hypothetical protein U0361_24850 [Nitrospiraceae bacterium]
MLRSSLWADSLNASGGTKHIYSFGTRNFSGLTMSLGRRNSDGAFHFEERPTVSRTIPLVGTDFRVFSQVYGEASPDQHSLSVNAQMVLDTRTTVGRAYSAIATNVVLGRAPCARLIRR